MCAIGQRGQLGLNGHMPWEGEKTQVYRDDVARFFDLIVIDGMVNAVAFVTGLVGTVGRRLQTGSIQDYVSGLAIFAATILLACAALVVWWQYGMPMPAWPLTWPLHFAH